MNDEYISREAMLVDLRLKVGAMKDVGLNDNAKLVERMIAYIEGFPTAERRGERRACWMYGEADNVFITEVYCPLCGKPALYPGDEDDDSVRPLETDFCPHCGAIMSDDTPYDPSWPFSEMSLKQKMKKQNQTGPIFKQLRELAKEG